MNSEPVLRRKATKQIADWLDAGMKECLIVGGARQVGKSFTVISVLRERFESLLILDFAQDPGLTDIFRGDMSVDAIISRMKLRFPSFNPVPGNTAIFLDEIQSCPDARGSLKSFSLDGRYTVVASGSLLGLDYSSVGFYPVGYEHRIDMRSLDFEEFLWAIGVDDAVIAYIRDCISSKTPMDRYVADRVAADFRLYMSVGGMPEAVKSYIRTGDVAAARVTQRDIVTGYRNDIGKYSGERERNKIFSCFASIPRQLSKENKKFMYSSIEESSSPSARKYRSSIDWMENAGIINLCKNLAEPKMPFEERSGGSEFKVYMSDTGLLLSMFSDDVAHAVLKGDTRVNKGALTENVVAECLTKCGLDIHYFSKRSLEVDFITSMRGKVVAMEVKSGNNRRAKSLRSLKENYGVGRRVVFEETEICVTEDGVEHYPLFAAAFADSMYERYDLRFDRTDADRVNSRVKGLIGDSTG